MYFFPILGSLNVIYCQCWPRSLMLRWCVAIVSTEHRSEVVTCTKFRSFLQLMYIFSRYIKSFKLPYHLHLLFLHSVASPYALLKFRKANLKPTCRTCIKCANLTCPAALVARRSKIVGMPRLRQNDIQSNVQGLEEEF